MRSKKNLNVSTRLTQLGREPKNQYGFVNSPIYRGSTVIFDTVKDIQEGNAIYRYGTQGTPTISNLEQAWTDLTGGAGTVISPSGLGALALGLLTTVKAGDHILIPDSVYRPTRNLCNGLLKRLGVETSYYDPLIGTEIEELFKENTSTLLLESPGSQSFEVQDVPTLTQSAKKHNIATIIDNTWATPLFFDAHGHGCDISIEAATKYLGGHSDLLMGMVSANEQWWPALRETYDAIAMLPGAEDCFLALRGLRTMHLRLKDAETKALDIAHWLKEQPEVSKILHPAFPECPGHEFWKRDFTGSSGLFSIVLNSEFTIENVADMLDQMSIFAMGFSWGGYESLITPFDCATYRTVTQWQPQGETLRIQIGLEDINDLKDDLRKGLDRLHQKSDN